MNSSLKLSLAIILALAIAVTMAHISELAMGASFENPEPPPWTAYIQYYHLATILMPPLVIALMVDQHKIPSGALVGLCFSLCMMWLNRNSLIPIGEALPEAKMIPGMIIETLLVMSLYGLMAGLFGWLWSKLLAHIEEILGRYR